MKFLVLFVAALSLQAQAGDFSDHHGRPEIGDSRPYDGSPGHGDHPGNGNGPGHDHDGPQQGPALVQRTFYCESKDMKTRTCTSGLERVQRVIFAQQLSKNACIEGQSYVIRGNTVTVSQGCRASFIARGMTSLPQQGDDILGTATTRYVTCESKGMAARTCGIPLRYVLEVYLSQQLSKSSCIEGQSFRVSDRYIEVSNGCRATFAVTGVE